MHLTLKYTLSTLTPDFARTGPLDPGWRRVLRTMLGDLGERLSSPNGIDCNICIIQNMHFMHILQQ